MPDFGIQWRIDNACVNQRPRGSCQRHLKKFAGASFSSAGFPALRPVFRPNRLPIKPTNCYGDDEQQQQFHALFEAATWPLSPF
jgi:hypothetical protein